MITGLMASTECTSRFCKHQYEFKFSIVMYCIRQYTQYIQYTYPWANPPPL